MDGRPHGIKMTMFRVGFAGVGGLPQNGRRVLVVGYFSTISEKTFVVVR